MSILFLFFDYELRLMACYSIFSKALMKEGVGLDNLAIAWQYPGQQRVVIPAKFSRLAPKTEVAQPTPVVGFS